MIKPFFLLRGGFKITDNAIKFMPLKQKYFPLLHKWMNTPHVHKWWGEGRIWSISDIQHKYDSYVNNYKLVNGEKKSIHSYVVQFDKPVGYIQYYCIHDFSKERDIKLRCLPKLTAALDLYIGEKDYIGKGLGSEIIEQFLYRHVWKQFDYCIVDPEKENEASIQCFSRAKFKTIPQLTSSENIYMMRAKNESDYNSTSIFNDGGDHPDSKSSNQAYKAKTEEIDCIDLQECASSNTKIQKDIISQHSIAACNDKNTEIHHQQIDIALENNYLVRYFLSWIFELPIFIRSIFLSSAPIKALVDSIKQNIELISHKVITKNIFATNFFLDFSFNTDREDEYDNDKAKVQVINPLYDFFDTSFKSQPSFIEACITTRFHEINVDDVFNYGKEIY